MAATGLLDLTDNQRALQAKAKELSVEFAKRAAEADRNRKVPEENWALLKEAGFYGALVPKEYGGMGLGMFEYGLILEELGQGCGGTTMAFNMHQMPMGLMGGLGLSGDKYKMLCELTRDHLMCGAASEPGGSSLLLSSISPSSYVEKVDGGYRMYGKKQFATNFESAEYAMVMFQIKDNPDPTAAIFVIVEPNQDGIMVEDTWDTLGMRATRSNSVSFNGAFVPEERVLMQGNNMFQRVFEEASANFYHTFSLVYLGLLVGLVNFAQEYLKQRVPRGYTQPMAYHPSSLQTIGALVDRVDQARLITRQVSMTYDTYGNIPEAFFGFSKAKLAVSNALMEAATRLPSACGANSLYNKNPLPRMIRDAFVGTVMPPHMYFEREFVAAGEMGLNPMEIQHPLKLAIP